MTGKNIFRLSCAALIMALLAAPSFSDAPKGKNESQAATKNWSKHCGKSKSQKGKVAKTCAAVHVIKDKRGRKIVSFMATHLKGKPYLEVVVPLGIFLPFGVRVQVDKKPPINAQLIDCTADGCRSFVSLNNQQIADLKSGTTLRVIFKDSKSQKALLIAGSLAGFSTAFSS